LTLKKKGKQKKGKVNQLKFIIIKGKEETSEKKEKKTLLDFIEDSYTGVPTKATATRLENQKRLREKKKLQKQKKESNPFYKSDEEEEEEVISNRKNKQMEEKKKEREIEPQTEPEQDLFPQIQIINGEVTFFEPKFF
jgi:hypothetical protein